MYQTNEIKVEKKKKTCLLACKVMVLYIRREAVQSREQGAVVLPH